MKLDVDENIHTMWEKIVDDVQRIAKEVFGEGRGSMLENKQTRW